MRPSDVRWCVLSTAEILVVNIDKELHGTGGKYLETELNNVQQPERARERQKEPGRARKSRTDTDTAFALSATQKLDGTDAKMNH